ncbi:proline-rich protein PRCC-like [Lithobates pipiens]
MNIPPPQLSPTSGAELRMPTSKPPSHGLNLAPPESESLGNSSEPVRISVPELRGGHSDSEEDEPFRKKAASQVSKEGFRLSSLLPEPKNARGDDSKRTLLPYIFTKKKSDSSNESKLPKQMSKPKLTASSEVSHTPSHLPSKRQPRMPPCR